MIITAKDLRFNIAMLFDMLSKGEDITMTYRGKPKAKLIAVEDEVVEKKPDMMFGMWKDQEEDVDTYTRNIRSRRNFDIQ